jgi:hypothetical protein
MEDSWPKPPVFWIRDFQEQGLVSAQQIGVWDLMLLWLLLLFLNFKQQSTIESLKFFKVVGCPQVDAGEPVIVGLEVFWVDWRAALLGFDWVMALQQPWQSIVQEAGVLISDGFCIIAFGFRLFKDSLEQVTVHFIDFQRGGRNKALVTLLDSCNV